MTDECEDGYKNILCRNCWAIIEHHCSCPKERFKRFCQCKVPVACPPVVYHPWGVGQ